MELAAHCPSAVEIGLICWLNRVDFETRSFQKCQYFELETLNFWLLAPEYFVSKLHFSLHGRGLATQLDSESWGKDPLEMSQMLRENPQHLSYWIQDVMSSDREYSSEELSAFVNLNLKITEDFIKVLWQE